MAARSTARRRAQNDARPNLDLGDVKPDRLDDPRAFVAENGRERKGPVPVGLADIGVADAGRVQPNENLPRPWVTQADLLDRLWSPELPQYRCPRGDRHGPP